MIHGDPHKHIAQDLDDPALGQDHDTPDWHGHTLEKTEDGLIVDGRPVDYGEDDGIIGTPERPIPRSAPGNRSICPQRK